MRKLIRKYGCLSGLLIASLVCTPVYVHATDVSSGDLVVVQSVSSGDISNSTGNVTQNSTGNNAPENKVIENKVVENNVIGNNTPESDVIQNNVSEIS